MKKDIIHGSPNVIMLLRVLPTYVLHIILYDFGTLSRVLSYWLCLVLYIFAMLSDEKFIVRICDVITDRVTGVMLTTSCLSAFERLLRIFFLDYLEVRLRLPLRVRVCAATFIFFLEFFLLKSSCTIYVYSVYIVDCTTY